MFKIGDEVRVVRGGAILSIEVGEIISRTFKNESGEVITEAVAYKDDTGSPAKFKANECFKTRAEAVEYMKNAN